MRGTPVNLYKVSMRMPAGEIPELVVECIECHKPGNSGIYRPGTGYIYSDEFGKVTRSTKTGSMTLITWYKDEPTEEELQQFRQYVIGYLNTSILKQQQLLAKTQKDLHDNLLRRKHLKEMNVNGSTTPRELHGPAEH